MQRRGGEHTECSLAGIEFFALLCHTQEEPGNTQDSRGWLVDIDGLAFLVHAEEGIEGWLSQLSQFHADEGLRDG